MDVVIGKAKLLETLRKNREEHVTLHTEAVTGWRLAVEKQLKKVLRDFKAGEGLDMVSIHVLTEPRSFEASYTEAIEMVEMTEQEQIRLSLQEFKNFVQDKWAWTNQFVGNAGYLSAHSAGVLTSKLG
jgi:hypothetical protein